MTTLPAPRLAERLLEALGADTDFREAVIGDLAEEFELRVSWDGAPAARRWYYREGLRIAPYLIRDWWRRLRGRDVAHLGGVFVVSSVAMLVLDRLLRLAVWSGVGMITGLRLHELSGLSNVGVFVLAGLMFLWTLVDGAAAGYIAARLGRRAPLPTVVVIAVGLGILGVLLQSSAVPVWFRALNIAVMMTGALAGGIIRASITRNRPSESEDSLLRFGG
jgi:hypothetical protein